MERIAEHVFALDVADDDSFADYVLSDPASGADETDDPIYAEPDFADGFFTVVRQDMEALVDDAGYAALLGTFGPSLLDRTGSRPVVRQTDERRPGHDHAIRAQMRAIPNNAILQQLGCLANSLHGVGRAAGRRAGPVPRHAARFRRASRRAFRLARARRERLSDLDVLRAYIDTLDPAVWLERARRTAARRPPRGARGRSPTRSTGCDLAPDLRRLFGRLACDWLSAAASAAADLGRHVGPPRPCCTRSGWPLIHRIWFLAVHIPGFRPQSGVTPRGADRALPAPRHRRLPHAAGRHLPDRPGPDARPRISASPPARATSAPTRPSTATLFEPIRRSFQRVREISGMIQHEVGAFG